MQICLPCTERDGKLKKCEEEIEKIKQGQKALQMRHIANGSKWTKEDESRLRAMQKMQVEEKKQIEDGEKEIDRWWHRLLLDDVRQKEHKEHLEDRKRQQDMIERRRQYDEQIASANRRRNEAIKAEREKENRKFELMRKKMEKDHFEAIQKKKEEQMKNKINYIEGHEDRIKRLQQERHRERMMDDHSIRVALEELRKEKLRQLQLMQNLQQDKQIFLENYNRERRTASAMEREAERFALQLKHNKESRIDECARIAETEKISTREKAAQEYRRHLEEQKLAQERERQERSTQMKRVRKAATYEIQRKLHEAHKELSRQMEYRKCLGTQIMDNLRVLESEKYQNECREQPFSTRPMMYEDTMNTKIDKYPGRLSTNPVHPFKRVMDANYLPNMAPSPPALRGHAFK